MVCFNDILSKSITNKGKFVLIIFLSIILALCQVGRSYYIGVIIEHLQHRDITKYILITLFQYVLDVLLYMEINNNIVVYNNNLFQHIYNKILHTNFKEMVLHNDILLSNINESINHINEASDIFYSTIIPKLMQLLFTIGVFLYYLPKVGISLILVIICIYFIQTGLINMLNDKWNVYWKVYNKFNKEFQDVMLNMWNIKYNSFETAVNKRIQESFAIRSEKLLKWLNLKIIAYLLPSVVFFIVIIYNLYSISYKKGMAISLRIFIVMQLFKIWKEFYNISINSIQIYHSQKHIEKICPVWLLDMEHRSNKTIRNIKSINVDNISFGYTEKNVINNLTFNVKSGETVSLIGQSGKGKSTIIYLLCRLYNIKKNNGSIKYNNININNIDVMSLRDSVTVVPQQITVFDFSIKENIILDMKYNKNRLNKLLKMLHLPDENTNAMSLSQGQKQRVLIARSLYRKNKSIYIFDEYLSAVDEKWSKEIHEYVLNYIKTNNKIGIFISHNTSQMYSTDKTVHL